MDTKIIQFPSPLVDIDGNVIGDNLYKMEKLLEEYNLYTGRDPNVKCNICNCWITKNNFKRHLLSRKHHRQIEWNLMCGFTPVEWEVKE